MAAPKTKTRSQRDALRAEVARLHARGLTQDQIATQLAIGASTVRYWLKKVDAAAAVQVADLAAEKRRVWLSYREQLAEAWAAWERSKVAAETTVTEKIDTSAAAKQGKETPGESRMKAMLRREGQVGDPALLARVDAAEQAIRKLLGLDAPVRQELSGPDGGPLVVKGYAVREASPDAWDQDIAK